MESDMAQSSITKTWSYINLFVFAATAFVLSVISFGYVVSKPIILILFFIYVVYTLFTFGGLWALDFLEKKQ